VGIGLPNIACNLARRLHAPNLVLIYESGAVGATPERLPISIGDPALVTNSLSVCSMFDIFGYYLQGGLIDVGFLQGAQIDRFGNLNSTVIGPYDKPKVRLPGAGGAPEIATLAGEVFIILRHGKRALVERLDFATSTGLRPGDRVEGPGRRGKGPTAVVTDLGILKPDPDSREFTLVALHPGVPVDQARAATGWELKVAPALAETPAPTADELGALRALHERTRRAHGES
ncbi:MAG: CoA-transferase subunit beta, partial [Pseudomonadota bacterium]